MQAVKATGSKIEVALAKSLYSLGYRYIKNDRTVFGKPDITFKKIKLAIFVDSEFWHGKDWEDKKHDLKSNREFWYQKIEKNIIRDQVVNETLEKQGWKVMRFWGKAINNNLQICTDQIIDQINKIKK